LPLDAGPGLLQTGQRGLEGRDNGRFALVKDHIDGHDQAQIPDAAPPEIGRSRPPRRGIDRDRIEHAQTKDPKRM